jgi:mediator of RNA polymerase II transcription subunit 23
MYFAKTQGRALKELSPEEVTTNVYMMVDVLLHSIHLQLQHGHSLQDLLLRASAGLAHFMWSQELLPFDVVLLALTDRDDDTHALRLVVGLLLDRPEFQQRVQTYYVNRGQTEHWLQTGPFQRQEPPHVLGSHLAGKDRYPVFFDDMCLRALPVIPLIIYRLIENDATETAERLLMVYAPLIFYHPTRFSFVRDTLAYFYGHLPTKLVRRLLSSMDLAKIPFSEAFLQHIKSVNSGNSPSYDYFANLLVGLVNNVIPPLNGKTKTSPMGVDGLPTLSRPGPNRGQAASSPTTSNTSEVNKAFYLHQDPGTYNQLLLETAVVELLSLPPPPTQIVAMLIQIAVRLPVSHAQPGTPRSPLSPSSLGDPLSGSNAAGLTSPTTQYASSPLMIQACGLLLAQLPTAFHVAIYSETVRIIKKDCWWLTDPSKQSRDLDSIFGYSTWDPSWAVQDETATVIGNTVALLHAIGANLPFEWLEGMHAVITLQRPITSLVHLRLCYRIMGPLLPRLLISRPLFAKTLALLLTILADVFGRSPQVSSVTEASEISDLVDFLHHAVMMEVQMTGQAGGRPRPDTLVLCTKAVERLRPDLQHLFRHLSADPNSSIYAATHPKLLQRTAPPLMGVM